MPFQRIHVENFKSFSELDIELSRLHVLIGSNAAGKSNFISIFKFLRDITGHGIVNAIAMQGGSEYLQNTNIGSTRNLVIRVVYQPDQKVEILEQQECKKHHFLPYSHASPLMNLPSGLMAPAMDFPLPGTVILSAAK